jgi:formate-nitrite transporter family protein
LSPTSQRELSDSDRPIEDEHEDAFTRMVDEGTQRLHRTWREVLVTGFFGGTGWQWACSPTCRCCTARRTRCSRAWRFSIGFLALLLGGSELFTEGFLVPVTTVAASEPASGNCSSCGVAHWPPT